MGNQPSRVCLRGSRNHYYDDSYVVGWKTERWKNKSRPANRNHVAGVTDVGREGECEEGCERKGVAYIYRCSSILKLDLNPSVIQFTQCIKK